MIFQLIPPYTNNPDYHIISRYSRLRNDLMYRHKITLQDAIRCTPQKIPLLNGGTVLLAIDQVITPKTIKKIPGQGMKIFDKKDYMENSQKRGDMYVSFEIEFPKNLTSE